ncbi:MAG TPA: SRPBCC domain-containing protein [Gemmatimonadales bacterium]|nr:SRPBCC domain-containing protein [Gemmatimonadales bacterium]
MTVATNPMTITTPADRQMRVERIFDAPRDQVWRAWTEPDLIRQWWGRGRMLTIERMEVRKGGHWRFLVEGDRGTEGFEGRYREVTPPHHFTWTFEWDGMPGYVIVETIELVDLGDNRTRVVTTAQFFTNEERDGFMMSGVEKGMGESYLALDRLLAGME